MRKVLFYTHLILAMVAGIFVTILGVTGTIMAFEPEIDHLTHAKLSYVTPGSHRMPLADLGAAVVKAFPGEKAGGYLFPTDPGLACQVSTKRGPVSVNPYTGEVLGVREGGMDFLAYVHQLHLRLLIRNKADSGKTIMSCAGLSSLVLFASGLYLWWPVKRFTISPSASGRRFWFDVHNAAGILALPFLLILGFTGVMIGFEERTVPMFYKMTGSQPSRAPDVPLPPAGAAPISLDQAVEIARNAIPGAEPFQINVPGPKGAYQVRSHFPEDLTPGGRSRVMVDQYTGKVLFAEGSRTAPAGARMVIANRAIHTGDILGIPSKTVMSLASLMMVVQAISGAAMWWKRRRAQKSA
jgi:uncharacterized iron-regulated membrane protein